MVRGSPLRDNHRFIEGYATPLSVRAGEQVGLHVSTGLPTFSIEIARVGRERDTVWAKEGLPGTRHPVPENASTHGCDWPVALTLTVPEAWRSGYYSVMLRAGEGDLGVATGEMFFVVRPARPGRDSNILLQLTTNTDYAYNTWGGTSLYRGPDGPGRQVSFERPYSGFAGQDGNFLFGMATGSEDALDAGAISDAFRAEFQQRVAASGHGRIELSETGVVTAERPGERWQITDVSGVGPACYTVRRQGDRLAGLRWHCGLGELLA